MTKTALLVITEGSEEIEAVVTIDVLRRAGINVTVGGLGGQTVKCSRSVVIHADTLVSESTGLFDAIVLPGGAGHKTFVASSTIGHLLKRHQESGKVIAAICAAPLALKAHGIGSGKHLTSYPSTADEMKSAGYKYSEDRVVVDGQLITSRGPGTTFEFALAIVKELLGPEKMEEVAKPLLLK